MKHLILLNEFSLFSILALRLKKQEMYLFQVYPMIPSFQRILDILAWWLLRAGWVKGLAALDSHAPLFRARMPLFPRLNWYSRSETMFVDQLGLDRCRTVDAHYDYAACKQAVTFGAEQLMFLHFADELRSTAPDLDLAFHGCAPLLERTYRLIFGDKPGVAFSPTRYPHWLVNAGLTALTFLRTGIHLLRFARLRPASRQPVLLAIDVIDNLERMIPLISDTLDDVQAQGLFCFRNKQSFEALSEKMRGLPLCPHPDGQFSWRDCLVLSGRTIAEGLRLLLRFGTVDSRLYLQVIKLSAYKVYFEGLLNKYEIAHFLSRDEYNAEHIIRSQALRDRGGVSLGLINGLNLFGIDSVFRYVDYDITFVLSPGAYLHYNGDNWRHPEGVRQIGAVNLPRRDIHEMVASPKSNNIVCFAKNYCDGSEYLEQVYKLARAFPDRDVMISLKKSSIRIGGYEEFLAYLENAPANVRMVDDDSFDLIKQNRYIVSGESSIVTEAISLGCITFFLDTYPLDEVFVYRGYEELGHRDGDAIVERIRGIERNTWTYPAKAYADLADLSGIVAADRLRIAIGLPPKDPPLLSAYWKSAA